MCGFVRASCGEKISRRTKMEQRVVTISPSSLSPLSVFLRTVYICHSCSLRLIVSYNFIYISSFSFSFYFGIGSLSSLDSPFLCIVLWTLRSKRLLFFVSWAVIGSLLYCSLFFFFYSKSLFCIPTARCRMVGCGMDGRAAHVWCFLSNLAFLSRRFLLITNIDDHEIRSQPL